MTLDPDREIYPSAPLRFVAFEVRFPMVPTLADQDVRQALYARLRGLFPISQAAPSSTVQFQLGPSVAPVVRSGMDQLRMVDRTRTRSVTVGTTSLLVETSTYHRYEQFAEWVHLALRSLAEVDEISAVNRIGLRYTDEIRIPGIVSPEDWTPYIAVPLHGPLTLMKPHSPRVTQGLIEYAITDRQRLVMRYGASEGFMVNPDGALRVSTKDTGPYFLIDLDSFWIPPDDELPEYIAEDVLAICDELHAPIRQAFEESITTKLRNEILRRSPQ